MNCRTFLITSFCGLIACTPKLAPVEACDAGEVLVANGAGGYVCAANYADAGAVDLGELHGELDALDGSVGALSGQLSALAGQVGGLDAGLQQLGSAVASLPPSAVAATPNTLAWRSGTGSLSTNGLDSTADVTISGDLFLDDGGVFFGAGQPALQASLANKNIFVGVASPVQTPAQNDGGFGGGLNTAVGFGALKADQTGGGNVAVGAAALSLLQTGSGNVAVGQGALSTAQTANANTAVGYQALQSATGNDNTAVGYQALSNANGARYTAAVGMYAGQQANSYSTAIGYGALGPSTGDSNIAVGFTAGQDLGTGRADIDVGNNGVNGDSHVMRLGTQSDGGTDSGIVATYIAGINGVSVSGAPVLVGSNGQLGTSSSSARYKHEIRDMDRDSDVLLALRPVSFKYKPEYDKAQRQQYGLIAEEVEQVAPQLVLYDAEGKLQTVRYDQVNAMLLNEVQKQRRELDALTARLKILEARK